MSATCIVIPCYNEEKRFPLKEFKEHVSAKPQVHFCLVNDGSSDQTLTMLKKLASEYPANVMYYDVPVNGGKAEAVRRGVLHVLQKNTYKYVGYFDADFATPLWEIPTLQEVAEKGDYIFVCGSRIKRLGADIDRNSFRHYFGRIFATLASITLKLPVYDTQCGAKIIRTNEAAQIFQEPFMSRWLFDVEIFARLIQKYGRTAVAQKTIEVPLRKWTEIGGSKVKFSHGLLVPFQLRKIKNKYKL